MFSTARKLATGAVAVCAVAAIAPAASAASSNHQKPLSPSVAQQIRALPHPTLQQSCPGDSFYIAKFARTSADHRVIVAGLMCDGATGSSPEEVSAYRFSGGKVVRQAYLTHGGSSTVADGISLVTQNFRVRGTRVVVKYSGYASSDPNCCPSHLYKRVDHLTSDGIVQGRLTRVS